MDDRENISVNATASTQEGAGADAGGEPSRDPRSKKIVEYVGEALEMQHTLAANVAVLNGDLLLFASHLRRLIEPVLEATAPATGGIGKLAPAIDAHLRICRQVERFSTFIDRLTRVRDAADKGAGRITGIDGLVQRIVQKGKRKVLGVLEAMGGMGTYVKRCSLVGSCRLVEA